MQMEPCCANGPFELQRHHADPVTVAEDLTSDKSLHPTPPSLLKRQAPSRKQRPSRRCFLAVGHHWPLASPRADGLGRFLICSNFRRLRPSTRGCS